MGNGRHLLFLSTLLFFLITALVTTARSVQVVDNSIYAGLIGKYVKDGVVDYEGFKSEEVKLDQYLKVLEKTDTKTLSRNEQFAFYVNAYNAWTIKLILSGYPGIKSIKDLGSLFKSPWKKKICRIDGKIIALDDIEHNILRPRFTDPRVHFVINCAAKSCPPLRSEPYSGGELDQQLDEMTRAFINDLESNHLEDHTLYVSSIFKWFAEDFNKDIVGFFLKYAKGDLKEQLEANKEKIEVKYLDYDWSLNGCSPLQNQTTNGYNRQ
ncbi:MAG: DUF547 domain-containing protein [Desulfobacterales bacterium]|nr:DUF547 domain-containing protein [Desulfobacterales bacterium]